MQNAMSNDTTRKKNINPKISQIYEINLIIPKAFKDPKLEFDATDHLKFKKIITFFSQNYVNSNYLMTINLPIKLTQSSFQNKLSIIKNFFLLMKYIFEDKKANNRIKRFVLNILIKLYSQKFFDSSDMILFIKFLIVLGDKSSEIFRTAFKLMKMVVDKTSDNSVADNIYEKIVSFAVMKKSEENILLSLIVKITDFLLPDINLSEITEINLINFLVNIHLFQYRFSLTKILIDHLIRRFSFTHKINSSINFTLKFLYEIFKKEDDILKKDEFSISNGFLLKKKQTEGIELKKFSSLDNKWEGKSKGVTFIFCFELYGNLSDFKDKYKMVLVEICQCDKECHSSNVTSLRVFLENGKLFIECDNNILSPQEAKDIPIVINKTYLISLSFEKVKDQYKVLLRMNNDAYTFSSEKIKFPTRFEYYTIILGASKNLPDCPFHGYLGSFFMFKDCLSNDVLDLLFKLKGDYDLFLCSGMDLSYTFKTNSYFVLESLAKYKLHGKIKGMISPNGAKAFNYKKNKYRENFMDFKDLKGDKSFFLGKFVTPLKTKKAISEFLKYNGIEFIMLHCEYFMQLIENFEMAPEEYMIIREGIEKIISICKMLFEKVDIINFITKNSDLNSRYVILDIDNSELNGHSNQLVFLFSFLTEVILKYTTKVKKTPSKLIEGVIELYYTLEQTNIYQEESIKKIINLLRNKIIFFIASFELYQEDPEGYFSETCKKIINFININTEGIIKLSFLQKLLLYKSQIIKNESYYELLLSYLNNSLMEKRFEVILGLMENMLTYEINKEIDVFHQLIKLLYSSLFYFYKNSIIKGIKKNECIETLYQKFILTLVVDSKDNEGITYLIQMLQIVGLDSDILECLFQKVNFTVEIFKSFILLCFEYVDLDKFNQIIQATPESLEEMIMKELQFNMKLLSLKIKYIVLIINKTTDQKLKAQFQRIFNFVLSKLPMFFQERKDGKCFLSKSQDDKLFDIFSDKSTFYSYFLNIQPSDETMKKTLIELSKLSIMFTTKPFIIKLLFTLYAKTKYTNEAMIKTLSSFYSCLVTVLNVNLASTSPINTQNSFNHNEFLEKNTMINRVNAIICFYKIISLCKYERDSEKRKKKFSEISRLFNFNRVVVDKPEILFSRIRFCVGSFHKDKKEKKYKYISEMIIEIYIDLYNLTKEKKHIQMLESIFLVAPEFKSSQFASVEEKLYLMKEVKSKSIFNFLFGSQEKKLNFDAESLIKEEEYFISCSNSLEYKTISYVIFFYLKFSLLSIEYNKDDYLSKFLANMRNILFNEIEHLRKQIRKASPFENELQEPLYLKMKQIFLLDQVKQIKQKIKTLYTKTKDSKKEDEIDAFIQKKIEKPKYKQTYKDYFKFNYDKGGKIKEEVTKSINTKTFAGGEYRKNSLDNDFIEEIPVKKESTLPINFDRNNVLSMINKMMINNCSYEETSQGCTVTQNSNLDYDNYTVNNFPKISSRKYFLYNTFSTFFKDEIYYNEDFKDLITKYKTNFYYTYKETQSITYLNYPSKMRNLYTKFNKIKMFLKPDMKFFSNELIKISHSGIDISKYKDKFTTFYNRMITDNTQFFSLTEISKLRFKCELITIEGAIYGHLKLIRNYLIFISEYDKDPRVDPNSSINDKMDIISSSLENDLFPKKKILVLRYSDIEQIYMRRFLYKMQANEISMKCGKSYFFNMFSEGANSSLFDALTTLAKNKKLVIRNLKEAFEESKYQTLWAQGKLSTFDYLSVVNFHACRSFNDINQYPIYPWLTCLVQQGKSEQSEQITLRNFQYPVTAQSEDKRNSLIKKYFVSGSDKPSSDPNKVKFRNHFNSHYSTSAFVSFYLFRINPFTYNMIRLQNGQFDNPNRLFHSFFEILEILQRYNDNRELVPEVFYFPEIYINLNFNNFGVRTSDQVRIHNELFDEYYENNNNINTPSVKDNPIEFMCRYRRLLESKKVGTNINKWIDYVFGINQLDSRPESCCIFPKFTYEEKMDFTSKKEKYVSKGMSEQEIFGRIRGGMCCVINFGQTPKKLFESKHPVLNEGNGKQITRKKERHHSAMNTKINYRERFTSFDISKHFCDTDCKGNSILFCGFEKCKFSKQFYVLKKTKERRYEFELYYKGKTENNLDDYTNFTIPNLKKMSLGFYNYVPHSTSPQGKGKKIFDTKYIFATFKDGTLFIFTNYYDNSIKFYSIKNSNFKQQFVMHSFVTSISKVKEDEFVLGFETGILEHYKFIIDESDDIQLKLIKSVVAERNEITSIHYQENENIIITSDKYSSSISIRNFFNFELINIITIQLQNKNIQLVPVEVQFNKYNNLLYALTYDPKNSKFVLIGYTINGIMFSCLEDVCGSFHILTNGNIITYHYNEKGFIVLRGECLNKFKVKIDCDITDKIVKFFFVEEEYRIYYTKKKTGTNKFFVDFLQINEESKREIEKQEYEEKMSIWDDVGYENDITFDAELDSTTYTRNTVTIV